MKKIISVILMTCLLLTSVLTLTSCFHKCEFSDEWAADNSAHWHVCTGEKCEEISDKADHVWDEGKITTEATQEADGVKTYTCTVCKHTKEEKVEFLGLGEDAWNATMSDEAFENFTYKETAVIVATGIQTTTVGEYKFVEGKCKVSMELIGNKSENTYTGAEAELQKSTMVKSIRDMLPYGIFEYDAENKIYNLTGEMKIGALNTTAKSATVKFADGKLVEITYVCDVISSGINMECTSTITFSDYGTTEV